MTSAKLPHMPLWVYDLEADEDCSLMSLSEYGAYLKLLQRQWIEGSIPVDPTRIARLLRIPLDEWNKLAPAVMPKFVDAGRGRRINRRCDQERKEALSKIKSLRENGRKGGVAKAIANAKANATTHASGSVSGSESLSGRGDARGETAYSDDFERWWSVYPRKVAKKAAWKAWNAARDKPDADAMVAAVGRQKRSDAWKQDRGKFIPHPSTWLNQGRWADEESTPTATPIQTGIARAS